MSVNTNSQGAAAVSAKHRGRNAEGSVRVLGQTAAVAGISGALLLALKAMVLVSPAVLPDGDGLDALGRPNSIVDVNDGAQAPVIFAPASNPVATTPTFGNSERTGVFSPSRPTTGGPNIVTLPKPVKDKPSTPSTPSTPSKNTDAKTPESTVGKVTEPATDLLDRVAGTKLGKTVDTVGKTVDTVAKPVVEVAKPVTEAAKPVTKAVDGVTSTVGLGKPVESLTNSKPSGSTSNGPVGGLLGGLG